MHTTSIVIQEDGAVLAVFHPNQEEEVSPLEGCGELQSDRRGGFVWPVNPVKRAAFKLLRQVFGSSGQVADWTRRWPGPWSVWDAATLERLPGWFATHDAAVKAEVAWIIEKENVNGEK